MLFDDSVKEYASFEDNQSVSPADRSHYRAENLSGRAFKRSTRILLIVLTFQLAIAGHIVYTAIHGINTAVASFIPTLIVILFAVSGTILTFSFLSDITASKRIYTMMIDAKCIGFSRIISVMSLYKGVSCKVSPVFEYSINGESIIAVYDRYIYGWNSDIAINSIAEIHIDPSHPYRIYSRDKAVLTFKLTLGLIFIVLAVIFACI